jgi:hypothetical protein
MRSQSLLVENLGNPAVSGLAKALAGEVASLLKLELARLSVADVQPVLLDVKQAAVYLRSAAKFECADLSPFDRNQRGNGFITGVQKPLRYGLESDASRRKLDASIFAFAEEVNFREILKLLCLGTEVRLGSVKVFRRGPESFVFRNGQQIFEVTKLGPIVHTSTLRTAAMIILSMTEASRPFIAPFSSVEIVI